VCRFTDDVTSITNLGAQVCYAGDEAPVEEKSIYMNELCFLV